MAVDRWIDEIVQAVSEYPDHTSPEEHPVMLSVSEKALGDILSDKCIEVIEINLRIE